MGATVAYATTAYAGRSRIAEIATLADRIIDFPRKPNGVPFAPNGGMAAEKRFVYVIRSVVEPDRYYVGLTSDVDARCATHNAGGCQYTKNLRPWELVASVEFAREASAVKFEQYSNPVPAAHSRNGTSFDASGMRLCARAFMSARRSPRSIASENRTSSMRPER